MLVLTRKTGQSIVIADDIEITVLAVDSTKVRLGISAPLNVPVHRKEIYLEIKASGRERAVLAHRAPYGLTTRRAS